MTFNEITNGSGDEFKKRDVESGDQTDTTASKTPDAVTLENDVSKTEKDDDSKAAKENGIHWLPGGNPKIKIYPKGIPETRGREHVKQMFQCRAGKEDDQDDWDYQDALKKFREMYPRAVTGDPRDPWRKKDVKPCPSKICYIKATNDK